MTRSWPPRPASPARDAPAEISLLWGAGGAPQTMAEFGVVRVFTPLSGGITGALNRVTGPVR